MLVNLRIFVVGGLIFCVFCLPVFSQPNQINLDSYGRAYGKTMPEAVDSHKRVPFALSSEISRDSVSKPIVVIDKNGCKKVYLKGEVISREKQSRAKVSSVKKQSYQNKSAKRKFTGPPIRVTKTGTIEKK
ncbi:MAG: hypothetical protein ABIH08_02085 [Candidatus Omnitrophota bacterium]